ncbi:Mediator complex subunit 9 [Pleurotus pulmonarius]
MSSKSRTNHRTTMSLGEADAKFPDSATNGLPPSPTRENPGQVFPKSDPSSAPPPQEPTVGSHQFTGNPFLIKSALQKLDHAIGEVVDLLENEGQSVGGSADGDTFVHKLRSWKMELESVRANHGGCGDHHEAVSAPPETEGGMFTD